VRERRPLAEMSKRIMDYVRDRLGTEMFGRPDADATATTDLDPEHFDPAAAQQVLPHDYHRVVYKTDMGHGLDLALGRTMDMPYKCVCGLP
jgi:hypothetical protein